MQLQQQLFELEDLDTQNDNNEIALSSSVLGEMSEMKFIQLAWTNGFEVADNRGQSSWDVAISKPRRDLKKVQVKTFNFNQGLSQVTLSRTTRHSKERKLYLRGDYDILALYDKIRDAWHFTDFVQGSYYTILPYKYCGISELHRLYDQLSQPIVINLANSPF